MNSETIILASATLVTALHAGLLYCFSVAIVPGLRSSSAKSHIEVMQNINLKIVNPIFMISFLGPVILLPVTAYALREHDTFGYILAACIIQIVFSNGITIAGNIPLNNKLAQLKVMQLSETEAETTRKKFQRPLSVWMRFHAVRTIASIVSTVLMLSALAIYR